MALRSGKISTRYRKIGAKSNAVHGLKVNKKGTRFHETPKSQSNAVKSIRKASGVKGFTHLGPVPMMHGVKPIGAHPAHSDKVHAMTGAKLTPKPGKKHHIPKIPKPPKISRKRI